MTTRPAMPSSLPSMPWKESINATSRPPAPALCSARPGGLPLAPMAMTFFSTALSSWPSTSTLPRLATSGTEIDAAVPSLEYCAPRIWLASTPSTCAHGGQVEGDLGLVVRAQPTGTLVHQEPGMVLVGLNLSLSF